MSRGSSWLRPLLRIFVLACFLLPLEAGLRILPQAIPLNLLVEFHPLIRSRIAARRQLTRVKDTVRLPRDDGGPADRMWIYKGGADVTRAFNEPGMVQTMRMDNQGFCNPAADAYDVDRIDVAALGDSLTWCMNVEPQDAWSNRLAGKTGLRIYNFGIPGRGLYEHLQILKQFGLAKSPGIVILTVYEGNDLRDAARFFDERDSAAPASGLQRCPYCPVALCGIHAVLMDTFAARHSYAYNMLLASALRSAYLLRRRSMDFRYVVRFPDGKSVPYNADNADRDEINFATELGRNYVGPELFDRALAEFLALARDHGFVPIVAYIPSAHTAYADMATFDDASVAGLLRSYIDILRRYFLRQQQSLGIQFIDLTPALQQAARTRDSDQPLYYRSNVHLTPAGHEVVAQELASWLASHRRHDTSR